MKMTLVRTPHDVIGWSRSNVSFQHTRYTKVTITRRLQTTRLSALWFRQKLLQDDANTEACLVLTLTCAKMIVTISTLRILIRMIEWGIVTAVIRIDELKEDKTSIFVLRESPAFLQSFSGVTTRTKSAMTSAANPNVIWGPYHNPDSAIKHRGTDWSESRTLPTCPCGRSDMRTEWSYERGARPTCTRRKLRWYRWSVCEPWNLSGW
jgi:hypothetical protein